MKKRSDFKYEKEFDTKTLMSDINEFFEEARKTAAAEAAMESDTHKIVDLKDLAAFQGESRDGKATRVYQPRPLTPEDERYEDILEHFASAPTKPKYWFEELGDHWSCSCGCINQGDVCTSCGLERDLLRSIFILHKPAGPFDIPDKRLRKAAIKDAVDSREKKTIRPAIGSETGNPAKESDSERKGAVAIQIRQPINPPQQTPAHHQDDVLPMQQMQQAAHLQPTAAAPMQQTQPAAQSGKKRRTALLVFAITAVLVLIATGGYFIYDYYAAPAKAYDEANQLKAAGKYRDAIAVYEDLGSYEDAPALIWECYIGIGDDYCENGEFEKAIKAYQLAADMNISVDTIEGTDPQDKINEAKFGYVKAHLEERTAQVETYLAELREIGYEGIREIYDAYYAWDIQIIANTSEHDYITDLDAVSRNDTVYFHVIVSGGEPSEIIEFYYEVFWPGGSSEVYGLDSKWQSGSKITAGFRYPIPLFGTEGKLTFVLYDKNTNDQMGSDAVILT